MARLLDEGNGWMAGLGGFAAAAAAAAVAVAVPVPFSLWGLCYFAYFYHVRQRKYPWSGVGSDGMDLSIDVGRTRSSFFFVCACGKMYGILLGTWLMMLPFVDQD